MTKMVHVGDLHGCNSHMQGSRCSWFDRLARGGRRKSRTAWELPQRALIDMAAAHTPYIDQSQSLNLFLAHPTVDKLSSMYAHAWESGLKTTYCLRSRPATRIQQATVATDPVSTDPVACSLENPKTCEACQ